jgi:hypothetical protein
MKKLTCLCLYVLMAEQEITLDDVYILKLWAYVGFYDRFRRDLRDDLIAQLWDGVPA